MKKIILLILILPLVLNGQVSFDKVPIDKQLVARNLVTNNGEVIFEGQVDNTGTAYDLIEIDVYRAGVYQTTVQKSLTYSGNVALFNFNIEILSELANYKFMLYGKIGATRTLEKTVDEIVAGDVYVIQGQSNAEAKIRSGSANGNQNNFIRVFAGGTLNESNLLSNNNWYLGQGDGNAETDGNTGQWGLKLARMLVDSNNIPVAIFNGARGGRGIEYFLENSTHTEGGVSPNLNNYKRLLYRLEKTNLKDHVRAVIWSQGENPGSVSTYKSKFESLRNSWLTNYPNIQKFYIFQTKQGCYTIGAGQLDSQNRIKEAQRQVAEEYSDVDIMTTDAMIQHSDNCHFVYTGGYEAFSTRIFPLVQRDFYGVNTSVEIEPPHITAAYFLNSTTLVVVTDANSLQIIGGAENFELINANGAIINNIQVSGNSIIFTIISEGSDPGTNASISNLGEDPGESVNFISNSNGIELVCFYEYPIGPLPSSTTWDGSIWTNNIPPNSTIDAVINGGYNTNNGNLVTKNLTVNSTIDFDNFTTKSIVVHGDLDISGGSMSIGDQESLVMYKDDAFITGFITKNESSISSVNMNDFTYWSSSVQIANIANVFSNANLSRIFYWDQSATLPTGEYTGEWKMASGTMIAAKGYISEGPISGEYPQSHNISFTGTPYNGSVSISGSPHMVFNDDDNPHSDYNLIGNPYPSAIDADELIGLTANNRIDGTLWFWTHNTQNNGEVTGQYNVDDYATYNLTGSTAPSGITPPTNLIGSGQGFLVRAIAADPRVEFNNAMRLIDQNTQFFRDTETKSKPTVEEKDRIWLNVESIEGGAYDQILIGFTDSATDGLDRGYDGLKLGANWISLYSKIDSIRYGIQGLGSFTIDKKVSLGFDTYISDPLTYKISIHNIEGVLNDSNVYLVDHELNLTHDLKQADYEFDVDGVGYFSERFTLQFTKSTLGVGELEMDNNFVVINEENALRLRSSTVMTNIKVYDITGRLLFDEKPNDIKFDINTHKIRRGSVLILNAKFDSGVEVSKKAIRY